MPAAGPALNYVQIFLIAFETRNPSAVSEMEVPDWMCESPQFTILPQER